MELVKQFSHISFADTAQVGAKGASLGQLFNNADALGINVPNGFAITTDAYHSFVAYNDITPRLNAYMESIDYADIKNVQQTGAAIRALFLHGQMSVDLVDAIQDAYRSLSSYYAIEQCVVVVRSSATAEDLPDASFAGQQESYLSITNFQDLLDACKKCFASLFTDRAIIYRHEKKFDYRQIALAIVVQKMVRADVATAGVAFSLDTETGFKDAVIINAAYGLGQALVQGAVVPDEYIVFKKMLAAGYESIIKKEHGTSAPLVDEVNNVHVCLQQFCLRDEQIIAIAQATCAIESYYTQLKGSWCPVDIEWAYDGIDGHLYIVQARPETVHARGHALTMEQYKLKQDSRPLHIVTRGQSIGQRIVTGVARVIQTMQECDRVQDGDIIVTHMTDPDWMPLLKKARGIITQAGGRTCHAAIVSRELGITALVGADNALATIKDGVAITIDCSQGAVGYVYKEAVTFDVTHFTLDTVPAISCDLMINLAEPSRAFALAALPVQGVGLARVEFIISNAIKVHPLALLYPHLITDVNTVQQIDRLTAAYRDKKSFFVESLARGVALIAAAFYPRPVIVRLSDFKTNEYYNLLGGSYFEGCEENPMLGFRGAVRYYSEHYKQAFALECAALKKVRDAMGLTNVKIMVPFVRTVAEGKRVLKEMAAHGLERGVNGLEIYMMCEIPSNVILIDEFLQDFDGISIGSNDLTQLTLGADRDSAMLAQQFDERDPAVQKLITLAIAGARRAGKYSGICGQAPSDYPEIADCLIQQGIGSISLNPDCVISFLFSVAKNRVL